MEYLLIYKSINIMEITINNKTIKLKRTFRSLIAYESAMGKAFNPTTVTESIMYLYCVIIASEPNADISYEDFMDWLDETPTVLSDFSNWLLEEQTRESTMAKKKSTRKKESQ